MYIPNSFTPDLDGINDNFCIEYNGIRENTFLFKVFNSQGDLMFQSANPLELKCNEEDGGWNGKSLQDIDLPLDIYAYEIYFQDFGGWKHQEYGTINLVR
jgi:gliding motility-associated-like protein